jgi:hypothetical protein
MAMCLQHFRLQMDRNTNATVMLHEHFGTHLVMKNENWFGSERLTFWPEPESKQLYILEFFVWGVIILILLTRIRHYILEFFTHPPTPGISIEPITFGDVTHFESILL